MSDLLPPSLIATAPGLTHPGEILQAIAAQIPALTNGLLLGEVIGLQLQGFLQTYEFNVILAREGPGYGLLTGDHKLTEPYPVYVSARCFGEEVWPPPPLGPSDPSYQIAPAAHNPVELLALLSR